MCTRSQVHPLPERVSYAQGAGVYAPGIKIIGTAGSDEGLQLVKKEGADHVINNRSADYQKQILDLTNGSGVNVILEALANVNLSHDLKMLAYGGRVVVVGSRGNVEITPRDHGARDGRLRTAKIFLRRVPMRIRCVTVDTFSDMPS